MILSVDGALIPLRGGEWAEVKSLVVGEVPPAVLEKGEWVVHSRDLSYFSRLTNAEQFEQLSLVELHRRGVENAGAVGAVMDGAEWEQGFVDYHCPQAVRILDFPHAGQRIGQVGRIQLTDPAVDERTPAPTQASGAAGHLERTERAESTVPGGCGAS